MVGPFDLPGQHQFFWLRGPEKFPATQWYRAGFSSLTSHAAGIVGFVGFQKIVVARFGWSKDVEGQLMNLISSSL